jgi:hypothetical protein
MDTTEQRVIGRDGLQGRVIAESPPGAEGMVVIELVDGTRFAVPPSALVTELSGERSLALSVDDVRRGLLRHGATVVIPVVEEQVHVGKRTVETGRVRIRRVASEHVETVNEPVLREDVVVDRVAVNRYVEEPPAVRMEGDTMIVPIVEEVVVKRWVLREELHVKTNRTRVGGVPQEVTLRRQDVEIERVPADNSPTGIPRRT